MVFHDISPHFTWFQLISPYSIDFHTIIPQTPNFCQISAIHTISHDLHTISTFFNVHVFMLFQWDSCDFTHPHAHKTCFFNGIASCLLGFHLVYMDSTCFAP